MPTKPWTYKPAAGPSRGPAPRARAIERWLRDFDPQGRSGGIYNPRRIRGSRAWSVHAAGRAIDWYPSSREMGDLLFAVLTGWPDGGDVQLVLWRDRQWGGRRGPVTIKTGRSDHDDHLHIETRAWA